MITLLTGSNEYEIERQLQTLTADFSGAAEFVDGSEISAGQLIDRISGATLFSDKRLVIIRNLAENTALWQVFGAMIERVSDDVQLILVEPKLDKRTATYKELKKQADVRECNDWSERDTGKAESWVAAEVERRSMTLDKKSIRHLVTRVGVSQWRLDQALEKLSLLDGVNSDVIDDIIEQTPLESVWSLFETALRGDARKVSEMLETLRLSEDPYMLFGLLSGQVYQLAVLSAATVSVEQVAKDLGLKSSYPLKKLAPFIKNLKPSQIKRIVAAFAEADVAMKTTGGEPWLLIERALMKVAMI